MERSTCAGCFCVVCQGCGYRLTPNRLDLVTAQQCVHQLRLRGLPAALAVSTRPRLLKGCKLMIAAVRCKEKHPND